MRVTGAAVRLAVFLVVGLLAGGLLWITVSQSTFQPTTSYSAVLTDVSNLEAGDLVRIAGVRVGQVTDLQLVEDNRIVVQFEVESHLRLTQRTRVFVRYQNLIGDRYLELTQGSGPAKALARGGVIPNSQTVPALDLNVLLNGFKPLFEGLDPKQINQLANNLIATLQGRAGTVENLLGRIASVTNTVADRDQVIGQLVTNLNTVLGSLDARDRQLAATLSELQRLASGLAEDRGPIGAAIAQINALSSSLGDLLVAVRPPLRGAVGHLRTVATTLHEKSGRVDALLNTLPGAYRQLAQVGSYGAFFNFYLCSLQLKVTGPDGEPIYSPVFGSHRNITRCQPHQGDQP